MFQGIIDDVKATAQQMLARVATRAAIGVVFLVAIGFAIAGLALLLVKYFGALTAMWCMAGGFALIGIIGLVIAKQHDKTLEERKIEEERQAEAAPPSFSDAASAAKIPLALVGSLLTTTSGFISPTTLIRFLARNAALVAFAGLVAMVLWPQQTDDRVQPVVEPAE